MARAVGGIDSERDIFNGAGFRIRKVKPFSRSLQSPPLLTPTTPLSHELIPKRKVIEW